jgi:hypothetical protein
MTATRLRMPGRSAASAQRAAICQSPVTQDSPLGCAEPFDLQSEVDRLVGESQAESDRLLSQLVRDEHELDALLAEAHAEDARLRREVGLEGPELARARLDAEADLLGAMGGDLDGLPDAPFDLEIAALKEGEPKGRSVPVMGDTQ